MSKMRGRILRRIIHQSPQLSSSIVVLTLCFKSSSSGAGVTGVRKVVVNSL